MEENIEIKLLENMINTDRLFHSYLFVISDNNDLNRVNNFIKTIQENNINDGNLIWIGNDLDLSKRIIENAKKQLLKTSFDNTKRILVIEHTELLNKYGSNMLLKFLEEPLDNVFIVLITTDESKILDTIKSRTMIFNIKNNIVNVIENQEFLNFYEELENDILSCYVDINEFIKLNIEDKVELKLFLNYGILYFYKLLINKNNIKLKKILDLFNNLLNISNSNVSVTYIITKLLLELEAINNECC